MRTDNRFDERLAIHKHFLLIDGILENSRRALGPDFTAYKNHCYRVTNFCLALSGDNGEAADTIFIAAAFHDLGIWTHGTFDYLGPSCTLAREYLLKMDQASRADEVAAMISYHHKLTPYRRSPARRVELFRKADWIDVSRGALRFGLPRSFVAETISAFPNAGFHRRLVELTLARMKSHPFSPLPMMKL